MKLHHPAAGLFPLMRDDEFFGLVEDIRSNGLAEPIVLAADGRILDGRNRERACARAGVTPRYVTFDGPDPVAYVVSHNLHRRHLSESQRAMVAARVATMRQGDNQHTKQVAPIGGTSQPEAATMLNVGERSIQRARQVLDHGTPELVQAVEAGQVAVSAAAALVDTPPEHQRAIVEKVQSGAAKSVVDAKRQVRNESLPEPAALPEGKYRVIYADPPWQYGNRSSGDLATRYGGASDHYPTMPLDDICRMPVVDYALPNAVLFLWATSPMLPDALAVMSAWGFQYKTSFVWDKVRHNFGHYNSVRHELLLVGTRGSCTPDASVLFDSVQVIERNGHSEKPVEFRTIIEALYTWGPRIELFARRRTDGWDAWGNEL